MRALITKIKYALAVLCGVFIISFVATSLYLASKKESWLKPLNESLSHTISVGQVFFLPHNTIILKKVDMIPKTDLKQQAALHAPYVVLKISWKEFLLNQEIYVGKIEIYNSRTNGYDVFAFLKNNYQQILDFIYKMPGKNIRLRMKHLDLNVGERGEEPEYVNTDMEFALVNKEFTLEGELYPDEYSFPINYFAKGYRTDNEFVFETVEIKRRNFSLRLWGNLKEGELTAKGYAFANTQIIEHQPAPGIAGTPDRIKAVMRRMKLLPPVDYLKNPNVYALDMDSHVIFDFPSVDIRKASFTLNNYPYEFKGNINLMDPMLLDITASIFSPVMTTGSKPRKLGNAHFSCNLIGGKLVGNGDVRIDFEKSENANLTMENLRINFENINASFDKQRRLNVYTRKADIRWLMEGKEQEVIINDINTNTSAFTKGVKFMEINAPFYEGTFKGRLWLDTEHEPTKFNAIILLDGVNANQLDALVVYFAKIKGRLKGSIMIDNLPEPHMRGELKVMNGNLQNYSFFDWMAETFHLPSMKSIDFNSVSTQFLVNFKKAGLEDINLDAENIKIKGFFSVDNKNLVRSKIDMYLGRDLLAESPKFRPIIRMFDKEQEFVQLDFQMSGNFHAMNFQWLDNKAKQTIQSRIPDFIERKIERSIDAMVDTPKAEETPAPAGGVSVEPSAPLPASQENKGNMKVEPNAVAPLKTPAEDKVMTAE